VQGHPGSLPRVPAKGSQNRDREAVAQVSAHPRGFLRTVLAGDQQEPFQEACLTLEG
jgi:hypothetical protein